MKNQIGLNQSEAEKLIKKLNLLLSNYQIFYINARGFHWNISGSNFFELHLKFEEIYTDSLLRIDEIAERILTLGGNPLHSYTSYLKHATLKEITHVSEGNKAAKEIVAGYRLLIELERELFIMSDKFGDEGTNTLMSDYIRQQEKLIWMYTAFLKR